MTFSLLHPDKVKIFSTREEAEALIPSDNRIAYLPMYTSRGSISGWVLAQYTNRHDLSGYLEIDE